MKVKAGETTPLSIDWADTLGFEAYDYGRKAYAGSLDAAKALHEAMLPGWTVRMTATIGVDKSFPYVHIFKMRMTEDDPVMSANSSGYEGYDPARAWLIAILRALIEQEGSTHAENRW